MRSQPPTKQPPAPDTRRNETGEVSSWLIIAAGLSTAALLAMSIIGPQIAKLAQTVGQGAAIVGSYGPEGPGGSYGPVGPEGPGGSYGPEGPEGVDLVFAALVAGLGRGDLIVSGDDLDHFAEQLAQLGPNEVNWIIANMSDEQLVGLFRGVHTAGGWSDDQRDDFYDTLSALDVEQKARVYDNPAVLDRLRVDLGTDGFLDMLVALDANQGGGDLPSGADADALIRAALPEDYLRSPLADGRQAEGNLAILNDQDFQLACLAARITNCAINGFVDLNGRQFVSATAANAGTPIHEAMHNYNTGRSVQNRAVALGEGMTEYFTRQVIATMPDSAAILADRSNIYSEQSEFVGVLATIVGEDAVAASYFDDDIDALRDAYKNATGRDDADWNAMLNAMTTRYPSADDWDDVYDLLKPVVTP